jgi:nucleoid DNA-binding protein
MNKSQLISSIAESTGLSVAKAEQTLAAALDSIVNQLTQGDSISLVGFGRFGVKKRKARKVRNPKTGADIMVEESRVAFFKAGKVLKEQVDTINK